MFLQSPVEQSEPPLYTSASAQPGMDHCGMSYGIRLYALRLYMWRTRVEGVCMCVLPELLYGFLSSSSLFARKSWDLLIRVSTLTLYSSEKIIYWSRDEP